MGPTAGNAVLQPSSVFAMVLARRDLEHASSRHFIRSQAGKETTLFNNRPTEWHARMLSAPYSFLFPHSSQFCLFSKTLLIRVCLSLFLNFSRARKDSPPAKVALCLPWQAVVYSKLTGR